MATRPSPPWTLKCAWCEWRIVVSARGARGKDPGSGVAAADHMRAHVHNVHDKTWPEFLQVTT